MQPLAEIMSRQPRIPPVIRILICQEFLRGVPVSACEGFAD